MIIDALPDPPSRGEPSTFRAKADAMLGALPSFVTQTNAVALEVENSKNLVLAAITSLGDKVLTVGAVGMYDTVQGAIDFLETQVNFEPISPPQGMPAETNSWAQESNWLGLTATLMNTHFFDPETTWFQCAGDSQLYRLDQVSLVDQTLHSVTPRIDATISAATAISYYRAVPWVILLLDQEVTESVLVSAPLSVRFCGNNTTWTSATDRIFDVIDGVEYADFSFGRGLRIIPDTSGVFCGPTTTPDNAFRNPTNNIRLSFLDRCRLFDQHTDLISPTIWVGEFSVKDCFVRFDSRISGPAHLFVISARGTIEAMENEFRLGLADGYGLIHNVFDRVVAQSIKIHHNRVIIEDPNPSSFGPPAPAIRFIGSALESTDLSLLNNTIMCDEATIADVSFITMNQDGGAAAAATRVFKIANNTIDIPLGTGVHKILISDGVHAVTIHASNNKGGVIDAPQTPTVVAVNCIDNDESLDLVASTSTPFTPNANTIKTHYVTLDAAFVVDAPTNPLKGQRLVFVYPGTNTNNITYNSVFYCQRAKVQGDSAVHEFVYDGSKWDQVGEKILGQDTHTASDGAYTPDCSVARDILIVLDADLTINAPTYPKIGRELTFVYSSAASGSQITYNPGFKCATPPVNGVIQRATHKFKFDGVSWIELGGPLIWYT